MNIRNYHKYFSDFTVTTSTDAKDAFGGVVVSTKTEVIRGYFSKTNTSTRDLGNGIPNSASGGILFTDPNVELFLGDIISGNLQVIDFDKHPSHNEYSVKFISKWAHNVPNTPVSDSVLLFEDNNEMLYEDGETMLGEN